ncbi:DUF4242 domain-containing protein [Aliirhizobium smilacinae]|uniref:DUF4242 domain-containing protein n=1 Tax=Aliirhizobium smilacinae TaxID=1395944 RepID=A0A5C4XFM1_9HYPH|nr:DUF4242 domain-containing protein [Rhizobium smilacinae]TNM61390.1 DUF4242 domain-containing protein [Rhizobium smilacinae]
MPQFVIERNIPGLGNMDQQTLKEISAKSNAVVDGLGEPYTWVTSYVTGEKMYCVHEAESADVIYRHAREGGFPADRVTEITSLIGPHTGR